MALPLDILREAQRKVPALRYALGVAGVAAAVAIVAGFQISSQIAVFGTVIMLGLMFVLVVFSVITVKVPQGLVLLALVAAWAFVMLTIITSTLLMSSYFFFWPRPLAAFLPNTRLFEQPRIEGVRVDRCTFDDIAPDRQGCSLAQTSIAAQAFCRVQGFTRSLSHNWQDHEPPTEVFKWSGTNFVRTSRGEHKFTMIVCVQ